MLADFGKCIGDDPASSLDLRDVVGRVRDRVCISYRHHYPEIAPARPRILPVFMKPS